MKQRREKKSSETQLKDLKSIIQNNQVFFQQKLCLCIFGAFVVNPDLGIGGVLLAAEVLAHSQLGVVPFDVCAVVVVKANLMIK